MDALTRLARAGVANPAGDLRRLSDWAYRIGQQSGAPQTRDQPNAATMAALERAVAQRARRQPVSQITGTRAFWTHDFAVTGDVLDPRPETETLVEQALAEDFANVLDLGTGSGAIIVSLLAERCGARGVGTDISEPALRVAAGNAQRIGVAPRLRLVLSDWFATITDTFDLIVSNPPYIAAAEIPDLAPEVRDWEPRAALTDGGDGLTAYRAIAAGAAVHLTPRGRLIAEIGPTQSRAVQDLWRAAGLVAVACHPDLDGRDRVVVGTRPGG